MKNLRTTVLGHNIQRKTLTKTGKVLVFILTKKHTSGGHLEEYKT